MGAEFWAKAVAIIAAILLLVGGAAVILAGILISRYKGGNGRDDAQHRPN